MTKEQMLQKSKLTEPEFKELVQKFQQFLGSLNQNQQAAVRRWMPSVDHLVKSFGPDLTVEKLAEVVGCDPGAVTAISERGIGLNVPNP